MQQEVLSAQQFFKEEAPQILDRLTTDAQAQWGLMTPQHMVEHLIVIYKMAIGRIKLPLAISEDKIARTKAYLIEDSPMRRSVPNPNGKNDMQPLRASSLAEAIEKLKAEIVHFDEFMEENPELKTMHPYAGELTMEEWLLFHRKHTKHHFIQFGLIPDYA